MNPPIITLTTDFGTASPYVAAMKGVILSRCPTAHLVDLSHTIPPQDVMHAAWFLRDAVPWFPKGTIHLIVVDPGVGTERLPLYIKVNEQHLLCPDNGVWTLLQQHTLPEVRCLSNRHYWQNKVSSTFHGRDIFAPCAAALANGIAPEELGPLIKEWQSIKIPEYRREQDAIYGEVVFIDHFGNLITNIPADSLPQPIHQINIESHQVSRFLQTYGQAQPGEIIGLVSSSQFLEIAVVNGSAAEKLGIRRGQPVIVR